MLMTRTCEPRSTPWNTSSRIYSKNEGYWLCNMTKNFASSKPGRKRISRNTRHVWILRIWATSNKDRMRKVQLKRRSRDKKHLQKNYAKSKIKVSTKRQPESENCGIYKIKIHPSEKRQRMRRRDWPIENDTTSTN